jgi:hypothetical protein
MPHGVNCLDVFDANLTGELSTKMKQVALDMNAENLHLLPTPDRCELQIPMPI